MTEGAQAFITAVRKWEPEVRTQLRSDLRAMGDEVATAARTLAAQHSKTIPPTIRLSTRITSETVTLTIRAGSAEVPLAGLFELGNRGQRSRSTFRHPVFGDRDVWVHQQMHPYLAPAVLRYLPTVEHRLHDSVQKATVKVDF